MSNFTACMRNFSWSRYVAATQHEAGQRNPGRSRAQCLAAGSSLNLSPGEQGTAGSVGAAGKWVLISDLAHGCLHAAAQMSAKEQIAEWL